MGRMGKEGGGIGKTRELNKKGRKVAFFTQLFLDTLLQGILLHSAYDWARYH